MKNTHCRAVTWEEQKEQLRLIRTRVFIEEQNVPLELEWDNADSSAQHFLVSLDEKAIGCARLLPSGQIGRMAILEPFRNCGYGRELLITIIERAQLQNISPLFLHAQNQAIPFYEKLGLFVQGDEFMDAGIAHHEMFYKPEALSL